jgi:hypothetical protein
LAAKRRKKRNKDAREGRDESLSGDFSLPLFFLFSLLSSLLAFLASWRFARLGGSFVSGGGSPTNPGLPVPSITVPFRMIRSIAIEIAFPYRRTPATPP